MYSVKVEADFSSAHNLRGYKGKCEGLHGHNWKVEVAAGGAKLDRAGILVDFKLLKNKLDLVLEELDHQYLNHLPYFKKNNPTSENIARYVYDKIKGQGLKVKSVTVWESENSAATYEGRF
ncbi:MAG: 6-carboxytetrahydropterin synthase QueD [Omnitrophica WOR_2 bacterium RIFCSPLOWO2_12_FULL_51_8]|nr:MAG: 6-carboxytetrahydropterin synthase QueD [Omnitrophica WOR_2 bacterium RIFCSPLOWO2_12_FULL_51_8]